MIIKALILSTLLTSEPTIIAMPPSEETKLEARRKRGKGQRGRKRGGSGLR